MECLAKFIAAENFSPVPALIENIKPLWGKAEKTKSGFSRSFIDGLC